MLALACTLLFIKAKATNKVQVQKVNKVALHRAAEVPVLAKAEEALSKSIEEAEEAEEAAANSVGTKATESDATENANTEEAQEDSQVVTQVVTQGSVQEVIQEQPQATTTQETYQAPMYSQGQLTPSAGVFYGPSGKETYYNLDMSGVIALANAEGIYGNYWIRSDGVKMLGNYVMCACSFDIRPRGTLVETSLGTGICVDTGTFAASDQTQIDIAVNW